jgi:c-di-GMP-binding flagellar brake protein YcgR
MSEQNFRVPLNENEIKELIIELAEAKNQWLQMDSPLGKIQLLIEGKDNHQLIVFPRSASPLDASGKQKIQFVFNKTRYEAESQLTLTPKGSYYLSFSEKTYKLQRRQNFRSQFPENWSREILINEVNKVKMQIRGTVEDISLTGLYFLPGSQFEFKIGDVLMGIFQISDFKPVTFTASVKRITKDIDRLGFGIEFTELSPQSQANLNLITLSAARKTRDYTQD